jgi:hypothetical protein
MQVIFLYGPVASGKLTIAREVARQTGLALFHNHLVVDAVAAVFPFGSAAFICLRERFWLDVIAEAARDNRSLIFTFAPEPTVGPDFPERVRAVVEAAGGHVVFVALSVTQEEQERRLVEPSRAAFGKLRSLDILRQLRAEFAACEAAMPPPDLAIDTGTTPPGDAAAAVVALVQR